MALTGYLAAPDRVAELRHELGHRVVACHERLVLADGPMVQAAWAQNVWFEPAELTIASIGDAVRQLRAIQRNWVLYSVGLHRRATLIQEQLPHVSAKPLAFGARPPAAPLGSWTLLHRDRVLAAARCRSPFPHGEVSFVEDKVGPPNRAYLKLWELFTLLGTSPRPGELCLDLGSSPGGWTWVLAQLGARVVSVDKAPLDPRVAVLPGVEFRAESAFGLDPRELGPVDWLFSDVVCYPRRLLALVRRWLAEGRVANLACTIKFQGATDHAVVREFAAIAGSTLVHLSENKHELTWVKCDRGRLLEEGGEGRDPAHGVDGGAPRDR